MAAAGAVANMGGGMAQEKREQDEAQKDFNSYFLLQDKAYKISIPITTVAAFLVMVALHYLCPNEIIINGIFINDVRVYLQMIPVMLLTSLSGYAVGSLVVLIYFSWLMLFAGSGSFVFQPFMLLVSSLLANVPILNRWYKSYWKTGLAMLLFSLVLGNGWNMVFLVIEEKPFIGPVWFLIRLLIAVPPSMFVCAFCYCYYNFMPHSVRKLFFADSYASDEILDLQKALGKRQKFSIAKTITTTLVIEALVLMISAFGFAIGLVSEQFRANDWATMLFATKFFILMQIIAIPVVLTVISQFNVTITHPVILMAKAVEDSIRLNAPEGAPVQEEYVPCAPCPNKFPFSIRETRTVPKDFALDIHDININTHNELGILYQSLVAASDNVQCFLEAQKKKQQLEGELLVAQKASEAKTSFLSNVSHEIRTPINAVLGLDEMIVRETTDETIRQYALDIQNAGKSLLSLVNDILDFSKIESGKLEIIPVEYDLSSVVNDLVNMTQKRAHDKGLELHIEVDETLPHLLYGDEIRIKQCVLNILTNAIKYTKEGAVTLCITGKKTGEESLTLGVSIQDTGIGIKKEDLPKLFAAFQRIEEERNRTIEGTGLGMNITQRLLHLMGSELHVQSEYGVGSEFRFDVSQKVLDWEPIGSFMDTYHKTQGSVAAYREQFHAPEARVLVVDDTPLNLTVVKGLLKQTQMQVDTAGSAAAMLQMVTQKRYDILLVDHRMPVMDGVEALHAMHTLEGNLNEGVPCIALTANAISGAREMYLREGFTGYLTKPIDSKKLEHLLLEHLPPQKVERVETQEAEATPEEIPAEYAQLTGVDIAAGVANSGGVALYADVVRGFWEAIDAKSAQIERYAQDGDIKNYTILVHALKSSARLIGALELSSLAAGLEQSGDAGDKSAIAEKTPALLSLYRSYKERLAPVALPTSAEKEEKPPLSQEDFAAALSNLRECLEAFDFDTADSIIAMLEGYEIPAEEQNRFKAIKEAVSAVDQGTALSLL